MSSLRRIFLLLMMVAPMFACSHENLDESFVSEPYVRDRWLSYLEDGKTNREEIIRRLGQPTSTFQDNNILGFRLILVAEGQDLSEKEYRSVLNNVEFAYLNRYYAWVNNRRKQLSEKGALLVVRDQNKEDKLLEILSREAEYSLVLVFDDQEILASNSLRRIMP